MLEEITVEETGVGAAHERNGELRGKDVLVSSQIALYWKLRMEQIDGQWVRKP